MQADPNAANDGEFPMPVAQFLAGAGRYLRRGDVVLCKGKASPLSWAIRWWTKSHFSHAALIFAVPSEDDGFERTFLIEAGRGGVDLTDLRYYAVEAAAFYDIAIKRLDQPWMTRVVQSKVRGHMLNFIKANYDYLKVVALARSMLSNVIFGINAPVVGVNRAVERSYRLSKVPPARFVCSGFVQYGFISAVKRLIANGGLPKHALEDVTFNDRLGALADDSAILATMPQDFAQSEKLSWLYAICRGQVHRVRTYGDVDGVLSER